MLSVAARCVSKSASRRTATIAVRSFASKDGGDEGKDKKEGESKLPFGIDKLMGLGESDNLIASDQDRQVVKQGLPDFLPDDLKKELKELDVVNMDELDELENKNLDGYNDLGLVPPEGTGTFASPILIPSRRSSRAVGYIHPDSHHTYWFNIHNDENTYYIKDVGLFFKMLHIPDEDAFAGAH